MAAAYHTADATCPAHGAVVVTPSDVTIIPTTRFLYIGGAGNVAAVMADGQSVVFTATQVGQVLPVQVTQVLSTGTTATAILALY